MNHLLCIVSHQFSTCPSFIVNPALLAESECSFCVYAVQGAFSNVRAACSLGFGIVNLAMSLLPDKALSLMKLFGFAGERQVGLDALAFSSTSDDMRAPIAM